MQQALAPGPAGRAFSEGCWLYVGFISLSAYKAQGLRASWDDAWHFRVHWKGPSGDFCPVPEVMSHLATGLVGGTDGDKLAVSEGRGHWRAMLSEP